jgi:hemoglobin
VSIQVETPASLYARLGGAGTVKTLVEEFYGRILADGELAPVFAGVDLARLKRHQALFISQALGGPRQYDGRSLAEAHRPLRISDRQFDRVAAHLDGALQHLGVGGGDRRVVLELVGSLREQVVSAREPAAPPRRAGAASIAAPAAAPAAAQASAPATAPAQSLYDKLGGEATIKAVVEEFYRRILADRRLAPIFAGVEMGRLKRHQALFISQALGGPRAYDGRSMAEAHAHLDISAAHFDWVAGHLVATLRHFKVGQADIDTVLGVVAPLKALIVTDHFRRWLRAG